MLLSEHAGKRRSFDCVKWVGVNVVSNVVIALISGCVGFAVAFLARQQQIGLTHPLTREVQDKSNHPEPEIRELLQQFIEATDQLNSEVVRHSSCLSGVQQGVELAKESFPSPILSETHKLLAANLELQAQLQFAQKRIAAKLGQLENIASEARTDALTGLKNRRSFNEEINRLFAQRHRQCTTLSLIMLDIDGFKKINDVYGHLAGDLVLQSIAQALSKTVREMDVVCRYGGDEFVVICPGSRLHEAKCAAERLRTSVGSRSVTLAEGIVQVTASLGVAEVTSTEISEGLIRRADEAMYAAKREGSNRTFIHDGQKTLSADASSTTETSH